jgi:predicted small secreted protein
MKTIGSISAVLLVAALFSACAGDHNSKQGKDTIKNTYQVQADSAKLDTSLTKSPDNSASGGASLIKKTPAAKQDSIKRSM